MNFLEKNISKDDAIFFGIPEPCKQDLKRPTQGTFLQKISFQGVIVSIAMTLSQNEISF
jgi:hypothetical protein